jgi:minor histocompatibility antigen H13
MMLFGLYLAIKKFGKEVVNVLLLGYFLIGGVDSVKEVIDTYATESMKKKIEEAKGKTYLKGVNVFGQLDLEFSHYTVLCFLISAVICGAYVLTHHFLTNNLIGILFCIFAVQNMFLGNFKVGVGLLVALFFYDIFWVFGTEVMITVAKNISGPIKLLFPKKLPVLENADLSLLGLGDIVIPGIFVSLCLRFDFINAFPKDSK